VNDTVKQGDATVTLAFTVALSFALAGSAVKAQHAAARTLPAAKTRARFTIVSFPRAYNVAV
jgi:hypothetical protein